MIYIGEEGSEVSASEYASMQKHLFEFHVEKHDYFLGVKINWDIIESEVFVLKIGDGVFHIPSGMYVLLGDEYGDVDWIKVDELISRPLSVAALDKEFINWSSYIPQTLETRQQDFYWPSTKHIIPIQSNSTVVLVSERDQYLTLGECRIELFTQV